MSKAKTRKVKVRDLKDGDLVVIPAIRGRVLGKAQDCKDFPSLKDNIRVVQFTAQNGPWKNAVGQTMALADDEVDVELPSSLLRRLRRWLADKISGDR